MNQRTSGETLDADELLHLSLKAMEQDRDEDALTLLKRALAVAPDSAVLHHLLGAMYAQLDMTDRAIAEMTRAVELEPRLEMARFQLGLMHYTSADIETAAKVWEPLAQLAADHHLALFRSGLLHLVSDEFEEAARDLLRGIELNTDHPSLNDDIRKLIELAEEAVNEALAELEDKESPEAAAPAPADGARHVLLSGYQGLHEDKK
jgi:tetratricopeptide (TPR) repeat protein